MNKFLLLAVLLVSVATSKSQNLSYTCPRDTVFGCGNACITIKGKIPDLRAQTTDYTISDVSSASACRPYLPPGSPGPTTGLTVDDQYSNIINIPFTFPFYGANYNSLIASTNGVISFNTLIAAGSAGGPTGFAHWSAAAGNLPNTGYDRAIVMGPYHDLDISVGTSPNKLIKYNVVGVAPNRKWILSFYKVPLFSAFNPCGALIENTHQIILHESSGVIEVYIESRQPCSSWNNGKGIVGIQDFNRTKGLMAPGRSTTDPNWGTIGMKETWRFVPKDGASLYRMAELLDAGGAVVATSDTTRVSANTFEVSFPNICVPSNVTTTYVIKTTYAKIDNPAQTFYSLDTINVLRMNNLPVSYTATQSLCSGSTGTITVLAAGTGPFTYTLNGGTPQSSNVFTGLAPGTYTITVVDALGCNNTITATVTSTATIPGTATTTPTSCPSASTGTITVTPGGGIAPYTYSLDGGPAQSSNTITGVAAGPHTVTFIDANNCTGIVNVNVANGPNLTYTISSSNPSCPGVTNGTITINPTGGTAPYSYSVNGFPPQASNVFTGLGAGLYNITFTDVNGCTTTALVNLGPGSALTSTGSATATSCPGVNNGTITITVTSGTGPYTFTVDGGSPQSGTSPRTFTGLAPGAHIIAFTDANGCTGTRTVTVTTGTALTVSTSITAESCPGTGNGTITLTPVNGTPPYTFSLDGGAPQTSSTPYTFTGVSAGLHTIIIVDNNGCSNTRTLNVNSGSGLTATTTSTATSCNTASNGTITITPTIGTAPYMFILDGGAPQTSSSSYTFTGVSSGPHTISYQDANLCVGNVSVTVSAGAALTATSTTTATSCTAVANGTITITPTSGTPNYTYSLDGGAPQISATPYTFNLVSAGSHTVTFTDANSCMGSATVTVTSGADPTGTAVATDASCSAASNGTITLSSTGPAPYAYSLDGGPFVGTATFTGVSSGNHTGSIRDNNGCIATVNVTVNAGPALTATAVPTATSCPTVNNGIIIVTPTSGVAPYTYSLDGGSTQPSATFTNVSAGAHTISFTDNLGCSGTVTVTVPAGSPITGSAVSTATSCPAVSNGTITVTALTGSAPYTYALDGGAGQSSNVFNNVASGNHSVLITDGNGCTATVPVTVAQGVSIIGTATSTGTSCPGVNNGTVTVVPSTGTPPYSYSIDGGSTQASATFTGVAAGPHVAQFTDANGCSATVSVVVSQGTGLQATTSSTATSCPTVNDGTITVNPTTGTAPYTYSLNGGPSQSSNVFTGLAAAASYSIRFTDALGCQGTVTQSVAQGAYLTSTVTVAQPVCANINDGTITVNPTSGASPYTYSLNGGAPQSSNVFSSLAPGTYAISFTDAIGCTGTNTATLVTNPALQFSFVLTMPLCNGGNDGSVVVTASGGVPAYQYSNNGGTTYQSTGLFNGLTAGTYNFRIKDDAGCIKDTVIILNEPTLLIAQASSTSSTCNGNDGTITVSGNGGTPGYTYSIDGGITYQSSPTFIVSFGDYNDIKVKDNNGCVASTSVTVVLVGDMFIDAGPDTTLCYGNSKTFYPDTDAGTTIFRWRTLSGLFVDSVRNTTVTPLDTTTYIVRATWGVCTKEDTVTVNVLHKPLAHAGPDARICIGDSTRLNGSSSNVSGSVHYLWSPAFLVSDSSQPSTWATPDSSQVYTLSVFDDYGCGFVTTDDVVIYVQPPVPAFAGNDTIAILGAPHQLTGSGGVQYTWTPSTSSTILNNPFASSPLATMTTDTWFALEVKDIAGCVGYDTVYIQVYQGPNYLVPNAFTPNGDGLNDIFRPIPVGIARTEWFRIFNRYGEMVFQTNQWLKGWDGTYKGKKQPTGVYVWVIKGVTNKGVVVEMKGTVTLVH